MYKKKLRQWGLVKSSGAASKGLRHKGESDRLSLAKVTDCYMQAFPLDLQPQFDEEIQQTLKDVQSWVFGIPEATGQQPRMKLMHSSGEMYQIFTLSMELLTLSLGSLAGKLLRKMFLGLEHVLEETSLDLLWNLLDMVREMKMKGQERLLRLFIQHLGALARQKLPENHPIHRFINQISIRDANLLDIIRACHDDALDELRDRMMSQNYRQELHDSCIVRMQRLRCPTHDLFTQGIWLLMERPTAVNKYYASCWVKILVRLPPQTPATRPQLQELASQLIHKRGCLGDSPDLCENKISLDAKRRLAILELNAGGVLCDDQVTEDVLTESTGTVEGGKSRALLHEWHEMVSIERYLRMAGLDQDAESIRAQLAKTISTDLERLDHVV